jgi:hypothetical protein
MKNVEIYGQVRYAVQIEGLSKRAAARRFSTLPAGIIVPTFPQRSLPWLLAKAACGGLGSAT